MMYIDLDELETVMNLSPWWSTKSWRPARFERSDFHGDPSIPLDAAIRNRIYQETGDWHDGPIRMLANLRYFGFNMNPITCYYCFDNDEQLSTIVAEVTNTPWKERQSYVLPCDPDSRIQKISFAKAMHVSPFNPMDMTYQWSSNKPESMLSLNLETIRDGDRHVDATLAMKRCDLDADSLAGILVQYPWMTAKVLTSIYWQALKLGIKRVPFYNHPQDPEWTSKANSAINLKKT